MRLTVTAGRARPLLTLRGALALIGAVGYLWIAVVTLDDKADRVSEEADSFRRIRLKETPPMTAHLGFVNQELRRETGRFAPDAAALLDAAALRLGEPHGEHWRDALAAHRVDARGDARRFEIVVYAYADGGPAFRLSVDLDTRRVEQTCTGGEEAGCRGGHWDTGEAADVPAARWLEP